MQHFFIRISNLGCAHNNLNSKVTALTVFTQHYFQHKQRFSYWTFIKSNLRAAFMLMVVLPDHNFSFHTFPASKPSYSPYKNHNSALTSKLVKSDPVSAPAYSISGIAVSEGRCHSSYLPFCKAFLLFSQEYPDSACRSSAGLSSGFYSVSFPECP